MINKVILMGRLTADPELRQTTSGISSCRFSVALDRGYKSKETGERQTDFINVIAWRQTAEFVSRYFSKGRMIIVEGSLRNNNYTDHNGIKHYSMDVQADNVTFGESKSASAASTANGSGYSMEKMTIGGYYNEGNGKFQKPQQQSAPMSQPAEETVSLSDLGDFEELLSDGEVPF
jgi:single-strand DNA-binding protein